MNKKHFVAFGAGMLAGVAIGGALGLLFTPKSGKETRAMIKKSADTAYDRIGDYAEDLKAFAGNASESIKDCASVAQRKGRAAVEALGSQQ